MKWKFYIYIHFILTFKKTKGLYLQMKCVPWTGVIIPKLVLIPGIGREFFWCTLVHGYEKLNSCISAVLPALQICHVSHLKGWKKGTLCLLLLATPALLSPLAL